MDSDEGAKNDGDVGVDSTHDAREVEGVDHHTAKHDDTMTKNAAS